MSTSTPKLVLRLASATAAALSLGATSASAQVEVFDEPTMEHCSAIQVNDHTVSGGCRVEFVGTEPIPLVAFVPQRVQIFNCEWHIEARLDENGQGYVTAAALTEPPSPPADECQRTPCDEAAPHPMIPWPIHIVEHGAADAEVELDFCLRPLAEGSAGSWCALHLELVDLGIHTYEIGHHPSFEPCEVSPSPPAVVGFENAHFTLEADSPRVEIVH